MSRTITCVPSTPDARAGRDLVYAERSSRSRSLHVLMQDASAWASGSRRRFLQSAFRAVIARYLAADRVVTPAGFLRETVATLEAIARGVDTRLDDFSELGIFVLVCDADRMHLLCTRGASARIRHRGGFVPLSMPGLEAAAELPIETARAQPDLFAPTFPETLALYRIRPSSDGPPAEVLLGGTAEDVGAAVEAIELRGRGGEATLADDRIRNTLLLVAIDPAGAACTAGDATSRATSARAARSRGAKLAAGVAVAATAIGLVAVRTWPPRRGETARPEGPAAPAQRAASESHEPRVETRSAPDVAVVNERAGEPEKQGFTLAWNAEYRAAVTSSPSAAGDAVVFGARDGRVYAIDRGSGARVWSHAASGGVGASPVVAGDAVIAGDYVGNVVRLRRSDGAVVWKRALREKIVSTPAVTRERVVVGTVHGRVYALSFDTGRVLWKFSTRGQVRGGIAHAAETFFVPSHDGRLYALAEDTGARRWAVSLGGPVGASPASDGDVVVVGTARGDVVALDAARGAKRWASSTGGPVNSGLAIVDGRVYAGSSDRRLYCMDAATGAVRWRFDTGGAVFSRPFVADGRVLVTSYDGWVYCLDADTGDRVDRFDTRESIYSSPVVVDGRVFFGNNAGRFYCLELPRS